MNVASQPLSKELYELSDWDETEFVHVNRPRGTANRWGVHRRTPRTTSRHSLVEHVAAYDLGYLLRKLPVTVWLEKIEGPEWIFNFRYRDVSIETRDKSPEDAAAKLCIDLFKTGILTREVAA